MNDHIAVTGQSLIRAAIYFVCRSNATHDLQTTLRAAYKGRIRFSFMTKHNVLRVTDTLWWSHLHSRIPPMLKLLLEDDLHKWNVFVITSRFNNWLALACLSVSHKTPLDGNRFLTCVMIHGRVHCVTGYWLSCHWSSFPCCISCQANILSQYKVYKSDTRYTLWILAFFSRLYNWATNNIMSCVLVYWGMSIPNFKIFSLSLEGVGELHTKRMHGFIRVFII